MTQRISSAVVKSCAEPLVIGHLRRWSILAYPAPGRGTAFDVLCLHPNPALAVQPVRLRIWCSRWPEEQIGDIPLSEDPLQYFDFLTLAVLHLCLRDGQLHTAEGCSGPEFYTLPAAFLRAHYEPGGEEATRGWVRLESLDLAPYKNEHGWNLIARDLGLSHPMYVASHGVYELMEVAGSAESPPA